VIVAERANLHSQCCLQPHLGGVKVSASLQVAAKNVVLHRHLIVI
jgi:hypothetical protein